MALHQTARGKWHMVCFWNDVNEYESTGFKMYNIWSFTPFLHPRILLIQKHGFSLPCVSLLFSSSGLVFRCGVFQYLKKNNRAAQIIKNIIEIMITALDKKTLPSIAIFYIMILYWYSYPTQYLYSILWEYFRGKKIDEPSPEVQRWGKLNK